MPKKSKKKATRAKKKARKRHTDKQKSTLLTKYHGIRKSGSTAEKAAKKIGVSYITLLNWEKSAGRPKKPGRMPGRKPKAAVETTPARLTLTTPGGFRIEADDPKDIIAVLMGLK